MGHLTPRGIFLLIFDAILIGFTFYWAAQLRLEGGGVLYLREHLLFLGIMGIIYLITFYFFDLHYPWKEFRQIQETLKICFAVIVPFFLVGAYAFFGEGPIGRGIFLIANALLVPLLILSRWFYSLLNSGRFLTRRAVIFGCSKAGIFIRDKIESMEHVGINFQGFVREGNEKPDRHTFSGAPLLGAEPDLNKIVESEKVDLVILATTQPKSDRLNENLIRLRQRGVYLVSMPALYEGLTGEIPYEHINSDWLLEACLRQKKFGILKAKRFFDILFSLIGIGVTSPVMLLAAILIKLNSKGPVLFSQERLGLDAKPYKLFKFRTMVDDAEAKTGAVMATVHDKRITPVGKFFRKFRIDELPQFFNVLRGEMSLIGPRPERAVFIRHFEKKIPFYSLRLAVKPGITGWAQVRFDYASTFEDIQEKFRYDLYYLKNLSALLDLHIFILTLRVILFGKGGR